MHEYPSIIYTAWLIFVLGLFSRLSERSPITAPMVFVAVGMLISPYGIDHLKAAINAPLVRVIAEVTLLLSVFLHGIFAVPLSRYAGRDINSRA